MLSACRITILQGFEESLPTDSLLGNFALLQNNRQVVHRTLDYISTGLQAILDRETLLATNDSCLALRCFCRSAQPITILSDLAEWILLCNEVISNDSCIEAANKILLVSLIYCKSVAQHRWL